MQTDPDAWPFLVPVDPEQLCLPDYFQIVKRPMDLSTIRKKLCEEFSYINPQEYVDDMWLMFNNAWLYNKKTSKVYKNCTKLSEIFADCIDPVKLSASRSVPPLATRSKSVWNRTLPEVALENPT